MTTSNFVKDFSFAIEVEEASLSPDTVFKELAVWDSLNTLAVIAMCDSRYGVTISGQDIQGADTIGDLWTIVSIKKKAL